MSDVHYQPISWVEIAAIGFIIGVFAGGWLVSLAADKEIMVMNNSINNLRANSEMLRAGYYGNSSSLPDTFMGLAYPEKGFFIVYTGMQGSCYNINDVLNACAHEWAHVCQGMHD